MSYINTDHTDTSSKRIVPNFWCQGNAQEVAAFITGAFNEVFPGSATSHVSSRYPTEGLLSFQEALAGEPLTVEVTIIGPFGDDIVLVLINAGEEFIPNPSISLLVNFDPVFFGGDASVASDRLTALWGKLSTGGTEILALGQYPFSERYGWIEDRHHISWQLILTQPEGDPRPFIMPSLRFANASQNMAREAIDRYCSLLHDSGPANYVPYPSPMGPASEGAAMFSDFYIAGEWITAMDSGVEVQDDFTCGVSLEIRCDGQEELDHVWNTLTHVPEAEMCGWLEDQYGVSWQVTPLNLPELMERPGAFEKLMGMKKLVIDDF